MHSETITKSNSTNIEWSVRLCHSDITVKGNTITRTTYPKYGLVCCLGNKTMADSADTLHRWSIKIIKMRYGFYLGMSQVRQVQQYKFKQRDWSSPGHGYYCVIPNGFVYSHSDEHVNNQYESFSFKAGDVLQFQYNPMYGKLTIVNGNSGDKY